MDKSEEKKNTAEEKIISFIFPLIVTYNIRQGAEYYFRPTPSFIQCDSYCTVYSVYTMSRYFVYSMNDFTVWNVAKTCRLQDCL